MDTPNEGEAKAPFPFKNFLIKKEIVIPAIITLGIVLYALLASPPAEFPRDKTINIPKGSSANGAIAVLKDEKIIRSAGILRAIIFLSGKEDRVAAGDYFFQSPVNVFTVARRLVLGEFNLIPIKVTIPEGVASFDIPKLFGSDFYRLDGNKFLELAEQKEGYLFPDTYFFYPNASAGDIVSSMNDTFNKNIRNVKDEIKSSGKSLEDIIIMASIIEMEAGKNEDRKIISGILWERLRIGMPLQVDAPFAYISDKSTYDLTDKDLRQDSPYNTYNRKGLPPGPICNPGMESILAAIHPESSPYLFYLSDKKGNMHYAKTYSEHLRNKAKYIR